MTPYKVSDGFLKCSGAPQATLGGSWSLRNHNSSALSVSQIPQEAPCRLSDGFLTCSGAPQAPLGGSWRLLEALGACKITIHRPCRCPRSFQGAPRGTPSHDPSALSASGRLRSHDLSCLAVFGGLPGCSEVTIYRACRCLEASQGAMSEIDPASAGLRPT